MIKFLLNNYTTYNIIIIDKDNSTAQKERQTKMNMSLKVIDTEMHEVVYPMDNPENFDTIDDFLKFNIAELNEIADIEFRYTRAISALENNEYKTETDDDVTYIVVRI